MYTSHGTEKRITQSSDGVAKYRVQKERVSLVCLFVVYGNTVVLFVVVVTCLAWCCDRAVL